MDELEKSKVRLTHWIDHNLDHIRGYGEVAEMMERAGFSDAAEHIRTGMRLIEEANGEFSRGLAILARRSQGSDEPGKGSGSGHCGHHHHHHDGHGHDHDH